MKETLKLGEIISYKDGNYIMTENGARKDTPTLREELEKKGILIKELTLTKQFEEIPVEVRWKSYEIYLDMVLGGKRKSLIAYGLGGVGKTFTATKKLEEMGLVEYDEEKIDISYMTDENGKAVQEAMIPFYDYIRITGSVSPQGLYIILYEHREKLVIFDDCDGVMVDKTAQNIIKGASDTSGDGTIVYASSTPMKDFVGNPVPKRFRFKGRVAFISNVDKTDMNQAICSRSLSIDLTMTKEQTLQRLGEILHLMPFKNNKGEDIYVSEEDRHAALEFFKEKQEMITIENMNARTLGSVALLKREIELNKIEVDWKISAVNIVS